jgi:hypothetical protein
MEEVTNQELLKDELLDAAQPDDTTEAEPPKKNCLTKYKKLQRKREFR